MTVAGVWTAVTVAGDCRCYILPHGGDGRQLARPAGAAFTGGRVCMGSTTNTNL